MGKSILIFLHGNLVQQIKYKTKSLAKKQYSLFIKHGYLNPNTGENINGATFELI